MFRDYFFHKKLPSRQNTFLYWVLLQSVILSNYFCQFVADCLAELHKMFTPHVASRKCSRIPRKGYILSQTTSNMHHSLPSGPCVGESRAYPELWLETIRGNALYERMIGTFSLFWNIMTFKFVYQIFVQKTLTCLILYEQYSLFTVLKFIVVAQSPQFRRCHFRRLCSGTVCFSRYHITLSMSKQLTNTDAVNTYSLKV